MKSTELTRTGQKFKTIYNGMILEWEKAGYEMVYVNEYGFVHRTDGMAYSPDGCSGSYYIHGRKVDKKQITVLRRINKLKNI